MRAVWPGPGGRRFRTRGAGYKLATMALDEAITPQEEAPIAEETRSREGRAPLLLLIKHVSEHPEITISGDLDAPGSVRLREALELALEGGPNALTVDGRGIRRIGVAGLTVLADLVGLCRELGVRLDLELSASARRMLDSVGLWWLGVIDQGPSLDQAIRDARLAFGQRLDLR